MADPVVTSPLDMSDRRTHIERINGDSSIHVWLTEWTLPISPPLVSAAALIPENELPEPIVATELPVETDLTLDLPPAVAALDGEST